LNKNQLRAPFKNCLNKYLVHAKISVLLCQCKLTGVIQQKVEGTMLTFLTKTDKTLNPCGCDDLKKSMA
jgi:hypothetical protein